MAIPPAPNWAVFSAECSAVIDLFAQLRDLDEIAQPSRISAKKRRS